MTTLDQLLNYSNVFHKKIIHLYLNAESVAEKETNRLHIFKRINYETLIDNFREVKREIYPVMLEVQDIVSDTQQLPQVMILSNALLNLMKTLTSLCDAKINVYDLLRVKSEGHRIGYSRYNEAVNLATQMRNKMEMQLKAFSVYLNVGL